MKFSHSDQFGAELLYLVSLWSLSCMDPTTPPMCSTISHLNLFLFYNMTVNNFLQKSYPRDYLDMIW